MSATAHRALSYPAPADVPDVPLWMQALAVQLDYDMHVITDAVRPAAGTLARVHRNPATGAWSLDTGAAWVDLQTGGPWLPVVGGALTGNLDLGGNHLIGAIVDEQRVKITTVAASGAARTLDAAVSPVHDVTLDQNCTFTFSGVDGDQLTLVLREPAAVKVVTWPATVDWPTGYAPHQFASTTRVYRFVRVAGRWLALPFPVAGEIAQVAQTGATGDVVGQNLIPGLTTTLPAGIVAGHRYEVFFQAQMENRYVTDANIGLTLELQKNGVVVATAESEPSAVSGQPGAITSFAGFFPFNPGGTALAAGDVVRVSGNTGRAGVNWRSANTAAGKLAVLDVSGPV